MNTTLAVVVSAIVILITALVVITIFSGGAGQIGGLTNAQSVCQTQGRSACTSTCNLPLTWNVPTVNNNGVLQSCKDATSGVSTCDGFQNWIKPQLCGGTGTTTPGGGATPGGADTSTGCCISSSGCSVITRTSCGMASGQFTPNKVCVPFSLPAKCAD